MLTNALGLFLSEVNSIQFITRSANKRYPAGEAVSA